MIDYNVRAERMGWLPSAPQLETNPLAGREGCGGRGHGRQGLRRQRPEVRRRCRCRCEDPDHPDNWPRNMFVWRSNLLGSSGKGHEYFLKHLLGTTHGVQGKDLGRGRAAEAEGSRLARRRAGGQARPAGDARLPHDHDLPLLRHRAADRHLVREERPQHLATCIPFIHPLSRGGGPGRGSARSDWEIYKGDRQEVLRGRAGHLGVEKDVVLTPIMHDTPANWRSRST